MNEACPLEELVAAERDINRGGMPERPFVLVGQQYLVDPGQLELRGRRHHRGRQHPVQVLIRPRLALDPNSTGIPGIDICSAETPPRAGAHEMNRVQRRQTALRHLGLGRTVSSSQ